MTRRFTKKTETIEIRLSPELKSALANLSQGHGRTMSGMVRALIEGEVTGPVPQTVTGDRPMIRTTTTRLLRGALVAFPILILALIYLIGAQAPATASEEARILFAEIDADGDDRITEAEIVAFGRADGWQPDPACGTAAEPADEPCTIEAAAAEQLGRVDADGDGEASFAEVSAVILRDRAEEFLETDLDENGFVSADEVAAMELYWAVEDPAAAAAEDLVLPAACIAQFRAEEVPGLAETCEVETLARAELAVYDTDRDGLVSMMEWLSH